MEWPSRYYCGCCLMVIFFLVMNEYEVVKEHETVVKAVLPVILSSMALLDWFNVQVVDVRIQCLGFMMILYISYFQSDFLGRKTQAWFDRMTNDVGRHLSASINALIGDSAELACYCFELGWAMVVLISGFIWYCIWDFKFVVGLGVGGILRKVLR